MANNIDIFSWASMTTAVNKLKPARTFLLSSTFKRKVQHAVRTIYYGKRSATDKLALFVNPHENPKLVDQISKTAKSFELPITREKQTFNAEDLAKEKPVSPIFIGSSSEIAKASSDKVLFEIQGLKDRVVRLREWMAAQAVSTGVIEVSQANISFKLDFGFVAGTHLITRTGNDLWTSTNSDPLEELRTQKRAMARRGYKATRAILGTAAADAFVSHAKVQHDNLRKGFVIGDVNATTPYSDFGTYLGKFAGIDVYEYSYQYTNASNVVTDMIATGKCVIIGESTDMTPSSNPFRLHSGPIFRINNGKAVNTIMAEFLLESIVSENKRFVEWDLEQCSLPAIHDPDAVVSLTII